MKKLFTGVLNKWPKKRKESELYFMRKANFLFRLSSHCYHSGLKITKNVSFASFYVHFDRNYHVDIWQCKNSKKFSRFVVKWDIFDNFQTLCIVSTDFFVLRFSCNSYSSNCIDFFVVSLWPFFPLPDDLFSLSCHDFKTPVIIKEKKYFPKLFIMFVF